MNGLPYYKAYPRDFIEGTIGMPFELKGAYRIVLDLIYMQGGMLPDEARYISGLLGCSVRKWNGFRDELLRLGKIQVSGNFLTNYRALSELESLSKVQKKQAENASGPRKNKDLKKPPPNHTEPEPEPEPEEDDDDSERARVAEVRALCEPVMADPARRPAVLLNIEVREWAKRPDFREFVLPVLRSVVARRQQGRSPPIESWGYFAKALAAEAEKRRSAEVIEIGTVPKQLSKMGQKLAELEARRKEAECGTG